MSTDSLRTVKTRPAGSPEWMTPALIRETIELFSPFYADPLTEHDAVEILQNTGMLADTTERKAA